MTRRAAFFTAVSLLAVSSLAVLPLGFDSARAQSAPEIKRTLLLQQDATIAGYQAATMIVIIPPGVREIRHTHPGPLSVYVQEGTLTLEHEGRPTGTYKTGEAVLIESGKIHQGINLGTEPVKLVATLIAEKGKPTSAPAP